MAVEDVVIPAIATIIVAGITVWGTAASSVRSRVREQMWPQLFKRKQEDYDRFLSASSDFGIVLKQIGNLADSQRWPGIERGGFLGGILDERMHIRAEVKGVQARCRNLARRLPPPSQAETAQARERFTIVTIELRNDLVSDLGKAYEVVRAAARQAQMVSYNPQRFQEFMEVARDVHNEASRWMVSQPGRFPQLDETWKLAVRRMVVEMRLDIFHSSQSFRKVAKVSRRWRKGAKSMVRPPPTPVDGPGKPG